MGGTRGGPARGLGPLRGRRLILRDQTDPVFGWRYWQLSPRQLLRSVTQRGFEWPPNQVLKAVCVEIGHPAPADRCNCGIYANPELEALRQHGLCLAPDVIVLGQVALWGKVVDDEPSLRGEFAYPARLSLVVDSLIDDTPVDTLLGGLTAYGVPVHSTTLDEAVAGMSKDMLKFQAMSRRASG